MTQEPGWYPDPFHRGEDRYRNGRVWTLHTRPEGSGDPTPPGAQGMVPSRPAPPDPAAPTRRHRRAFLLTGVVAVLLLGAGIGIYEALGGHDATASAAIATAASQSLSEKSVQMTFQMEISAPGMSEQVSGNGAFDFANQSGTMTVSVPVGGQQYTQQVILVGQTAYVSLPPAAQPVPGKAWASENVSQFSSGSDASGSGFSQFEDPAALLQRLRSLGGTVTTFGPTTFDGSAVTAYSVAVSASQLEHNLGQSGLPSSLKQFASGLSFPNVDVKVYVGSDGLLRGIDMPFSLTIGGQSISEHFEMTFFDYGAPVTVTPPPAQEVVPLSQLGAGAGGIDGLGNSGNTGTSGTL